MLLIGLNLVTFGFHSTLLEINNKWKTKKRKKGINELKKKFNNFKKKINDLKKSLMNCEDFVRMRFSILNIIADII